MFRKGIALVIMLLFVGLSIAPSSGIIVEDVSTHILDAINESEELFSHVKTAYAWNAYPGPNGPCYFQLDDPGNITMLSIFEAPGFISGGTWTNDDRWIGCDYSSGALWEIDPLEGDMESIGGGGTGLNGLAYDPVNEKLYGASSYDLYQIDIESGEQEYIGAFGGSVYLMIAIAFDEGGILYGWDIGDKLWTINTETGTAIEVGSLGIDINYAQDGAFDYETDILYLSAYTLSPYYGGYLYECDEDTGNCTLIGQFEDNAELTALAIPYINDTLPPITTIRLIPSNPDGDNGWYVSNVSVKLWARGVMYEVNTTYYRINEGEWQIYESPFVLSEDGENILIEYYSVDTVGNIEEVKSETIDIDKTPPDVGDIGWVAYKKGCTWYVDFIFNITDETSGMDRVEFFINDGHHETIEGVGPEYVFTIEWSETLRPHKGWFYHYDVAGNVIEDDIEFSCIRSYIVSQRKQVKPISKTLQGILTIQIGEKLYV